jgi:hypothetical protein
MPRRDSLGLTAVRTEGAILPPSLLQRVHREDPALGGMKPEEFGLSGTRVREAASQAWNALQAPWRAFQGERARLAPAEAGTGMTRGRWLVQILKALDYGAMDPLKGSLTVGDHEYAVSHLYHHAPLHLVGCNLDLDKRTPGAVGAARMTPHGMVQLLLNSADAHLWGFASNGLRWRILRDSISLSRQAMVEFDLEAIFDGQLYDEFLLFYLLCHQSRVKSERPEECWLERWSQTAGAEGKRALDTLRDGVQRAIETLGQGFLKHASNQAIRQSLRDGSLDRQGYYRQLLRLVYRLLFLFVAEDRNLLLLPETPAEARELYTEYYSTQRLRLLAERLRGSPRHHDFFQQLRLILEKLAQEDGCPELGLPALGGFLFSDEACPDLDACELSNADLLEAIRCLAVTQEGGRRARVDYRNLASEEMGSVYESLLELHPELNSDGTKFELRNASGNERKTTGSYYTPDSLIQCLLDTALDPVLDEAVRTAGERFKPKDGEPPDAQAILALNVIDPACGSGHFLIAAAHRLAKRLAQIRTGDEEPAPEPTRRAVRDVIGRCLYGIDVNPMSAELCKVGLWMEALEPGKPLSFLDHHIVVGNSLLGATPELIAAGIPDDAYTPIEGDDRAVCSSLKRQNKAEREGQGSLFAPEVFAGGSLLAAWERLEGLADDTLAGVRSKARQYREAQAAVEMRRRLADTWCAAFVLPKLSVPASGFRGITTATLRALASGQALDPPTADAVAEAAERFAFLHPHLTFPDVFAPRSPHHSPLATPHSPSSGFDVVLGNPPWEHTELKEKEWFAERRPQVAAARTGAERKRLISALASEDPRVYRDYCFAKREHDLAGAFCGRSGRFPLCGRGRINTYAVFAEAMRSLLAAQGRAGIVVPTGIATDDTTKYFFADLMACRALASLFDFENGARAAGESAGEAEEEGEGEAQPPPAIKRRGRGASPAERLLFPAVDSRFKFCLLTLSGQPAAQPRFAFFCHRVSDLETPGKVFMLTPEDIALLNPNTRTCPVFRTQRDAEITRAIYRRVPVLIREGDPNGNPWGITFKQGLFNMTSDSHLFRTREELEAAGGTLEGNRWTVPAPWTLPDGREVEAGLWLPLYEAKMMQQFDHRAADVVKSPTAVARQNQPLAIPLNEKRDVTRVAMPMYWVHPSGVQCLYEGQTAYLGYTWVTSPTNMRTMIAAIIPAAGAGNSLPLIHTTRGLPGQLWLVACLNSFAYDYVARQKLGGVNYTFGFSQQQPVLKPDSVFASGESLIADASFVLPRSFELAYTSRDLEVTATELGYVGRPHAWDEHRRFWLRAELDAAFFHLYGLGRADVDYIMETFPTVRRKDVAAYNRYRTKEAILEIYDAMADAARTGVPYRTRLDPPPANGWEPEEANGEWGLGTGEGGLQGAGARGLQAAVGAGDRRAGGGRRRGRAAGDVETQAVLPLAYTAGGDP